MQEFRNKVAVVTGAASGIGRGIAERCAQEGMHVVLADIEEPALQEAAESMRWLGATVLPVCTDVSKAGDVDELARKTLDAFGAVHLLFNNAGVGAGGSVWESTLADWEWVLGVNLWGVIHGVRSFVPIMLAQDTACHIVNTASIAGLISAPQLGSPYLVTKHAVVALSEHLQCTLAERHAQIDVSVLCPGWVNTAIMDSERNRPHELQNEPAPPNPGDDAIEREIRTALQSGMSPNVVADFVFRAIRSGRFYILTHPEASVLVQQRMEGILGDGILTC